MYSIQSASGNTTTSVDTRVGGRRQPRPLNRFDPAVAAIDHKDTSFKAQLATALKRFETEPGFFTEVEKLIQNHLEVFLVNSQAASLKRFCTEANKISELIFQNLTSDVRRRSALEIIKCLYVKFVNSQRTSKAKDGEQAFTLLTGYARNPVYMCYGLDFDHATESIPIFKEAQAITISPEVTQVLNDVFKPVSDHIDFGKWHYALFDNFGPIKEEGFVLCSTMPFINKEAIEENRASYAEYYNQDELIVHEMSHALLRELGYEENNENSFIKGFDRAQVHELIALSVGMQFSTLPVLSNLYSHVYSGDTPFELANRLDPTIRLLTDTIDSFLTKQGTSFSEIMSKVQHMEELDKDWFPSFIEVLKDQLGDYGLMNLEQFIQKRFKHEAQKMVKALAVNGAF